MGLHPHIRLSFLLCLGVVLALFTSCSTTSRFNSSTSISYEPALLAQSLPPVLNSAPAFFPTPTIDSSAPQSTPAVFDYLVPESGPSQPLILRPAPHPSTSTNAVASLKELTPSRTVVSIPKQYSQMKWLFEDGEKESGSIFDFFILALGIVLFLTMLASVLFLVVVILYGYSVGGSVAGAYLFCLVFFLVGLVGLLLLRRKLIGFFNNP